MPDDLSFGQWLKRQRRLLDLTQEELAARVGYATTTIRRIEADELKPSKELADKLAAALDLPSDERPDFVRFARGERGAALPLPQPQGAPASASTATSPTPSIPPLPLALRHNLPVQLSSFIGREREMDRVQALLDSSRLMTLTGVGGTGKTRLALEVAARLVDRYAHGVWLVELAPLMDPALVPQAIATALTVRDEPGRPLLAALTDYLREKHLLLILDNCEHLIEACAQVVESLLRVCRQLQVMATGREALGLVGETIFQVPSLALPDRDTVLPERLAQSEAIRLFVVRAGAVQPGFVATGENLPSIIHICRTLDGIPLALELAAARVRSLPVAQIAARIDDRFRLLTGGSRTALSRQRTLQGLMDWSYGLLTEAERTLLQRLSVFAGSWTLDAAEAVCADDEGRRTKDQDSQASRVGPPSSVLRRTDVLDLLTRLVEKSLVQVESQATEARYRLLETIRQYAREKLVEAGAAEVIQDRHLAYYVALAEEGEIKLRGPEQMTWLERLEMEHDNLRAALAWSQTATQGAEAGLRLGGATAWYWYFSHRTNEGGHWLESVLAQPGAQARTALRAKALWGRAQLAYERDDQTPVGAWLEESIAIGREVGATWQVAWALRSLGWLMATRGAPAAARVVWAESQVHMRATGDPWGLAYCLCDQGAAALLVSGDYVAARSSLEAGEAIFRELGDQIGLIGAPSPLAVIDIHDGHLAAARTRIEERLRFARKIGDKHGIRLALGALGYVAFLESNYDTATLLFKECLVLVQSGESRHGTWLYTLNCLAGLAGVATAQGRVPHAAKLLAVVETRGSTLTLSFGPDFQAQYDRNRAIVRAHLDDAEVAAAWADGEAMTLEEAIAYALATSDEEVE